MNGGRTRREKTWEETFNERGRVEARCRSGNEKERSVFNTKKLQIRWSEEKECTEEKKFRGKGRELHQMTCSQNDRHDPHGNHKSHSAHRGRGFYWGGREEHYQGNVEK